MTNRTSITVLISMMVQAVLFGIGLVTTLMVTADSGARTWGIVATIVVSLLAGPPLAWWLAPRLRARYVREHVPPQAEEL
ncbi:MAG: hypothetical protein ACM3Q1_06045 [Bacteroidales bacterium]